MLAKAYLAKKQVEQGETLVNQAIESIKVLFGDSHPLIAVKFNQCLIEALNSKPESEERTN